MIREHMIQHILFDLDGTLADTLEDIVMILCRVLRQKGLGCPEEKVRSLIREGKNLPQLYRAILPPELEEMVDECIADYIPQYERNFPGNASLYEGIPVVLETLHGRGITMALATSKRRKVASMALEHFGIERYFGYVGGFEDVQRHKPHPDLLFRVMEKLGWNPDRTLMVGDTVADVNAGKAAGVRTCAALYGFSLPGVLESLGSDHIIREPLELLKIV